MKRLHIIDSHTGGEPTRLVMKGFPDLPGNSIAEKRDALREGHDQWRRACLLEPRGNDVLVGALYCAPVSPDATCGVIFFNNAGYLGMCGHGTIGLVNSLHYLGQIEPGVHQIDTPVGPVSATLHEDGALTLGNVPAWRYRKQVPVDVHTFVPAEVTFPRSSGGFMFCHLLDVDPVEGLGINVHIPPDPRYLKEGVSVTIHWEGHKGYNPAGPLPPDPIPGTDLNFTFPPVTAAQVASGLNWVVRPYTTKILPLYGGPSDQIGRGIVSYTVSGVSSPSPDATLNVAVGTPSGTCPIP